MKKVIVVFQLFWLSAVFGTGVDRGLCTDFTGVYEYNADRLQLILTQVGCQRVVIPDQLDLTIGSSTTTCIPDDLKTTVRASFIDNGKTLSIVTYACNESSGNLYPWKWMEDQPLNHLVFLRLLGTCLGSL